MLVEGARKKVQRLISVIPQCKEMKTYLLKNKSYHINEKEKLIMKVVIDILEAYYKEYDGPKYKNYRNKLIPLALKFYQKIENEEL